jgi:hypothetical protein
VAAALALAAPAGATPKDAIVLPPVTPIADCESCPALHHPDPEAEQRAAVLARDLLRVIVESVQDLGFNVDVSAQPDSSTAHPSEQSLIDRAQSSWVISPRLELAGSKLVVRIVAVQPAGKVLFVRTETVAPKELEIRTVLMMRDLVRAAGAPSEAPVRAETTDEHAVVREAHSPGRAVLALNAAAFGGYVGFALQRAGGSNDARLTYPLIALGAGIGLGASMVATDEWDIGVGDAWYLSAGTWWPLLGALLLADDEPDKRRLLYGAAAGGAGLALATTALTFGPVSEGGAMIAHSGGAFGTVLGGVADLIVQGRTNVTPTRGMGAGAMVGVTLTGVLARLTPPQPSSRVLLVDLAAGLGSLTGAAVASPLVFGNVTATRNRLWLSSIAVGTFVGAGIGLMTTSHAHDQARREPTIVPLAGVIGAVANPDGTSSPVTGAGISGVW